jgi:hypothetical protein
VWEVEVLIQPFLEPLAQTYDCFEGLGVGVVEEVGVDLVGQFKFAVGVHQLIVLAFLNVYKCD